MPGVKDRIEKIDLMTVRHYRHLLEGLALVMQPVAFQVNAPPLTDFPSLMSRLARTRCCSFIFMGRLKRALCC